MDRNGPSRLPSGAQGAAGSVMLPMSLGPVQRGSEGGSLGIGNLSCYLFILERRLNSNQPKPSTQLLLKGAGKLRSLRICSLANF